MTERTTPFAYRLGSPANLMTFWIAVAACLLSSNGWAGSAEIGPSSSAPAGEVSSDGLYILSGLKTGRITTRNLLEDPRFENGPFQGRRILEVGRVVRSFDLSFDGRKVVFGWLQPAPRAFKIVSVNVDGSDLRQLTDGDFRP